MSVRASIRRSLGTEPATAWSAKERRGQLPIIGGDMKLTPKGESRPAPASWGIHPQAR
jgi:hypothetical protein